MEGDIVLADEVVGLHTGIGPARYPPVLPLIWFALALGPFNAGREVANNGVEPDINALILVAFKRNGHAPIQIACNRAGAQALFQPVHSEGQRIGSPVLLAL